MSGVADASMLGLVYSRRLQIPMRLLLQEGR